MLKTVGRLFRKRYLLSVPVVAIILYVYLMTEKYQPQYISFKIVLTEEAECKNYCFNLKKIYVCGSDGLTYFNLCHLKCAKKTDLKVAYFGKCEDFHQEFKQKTMNINTDLTLLNKLNIPIIEITEILDHKYELHSLGTTNATPTVIDNFNEDLLAKQRMLEAKYGLKKLDGNELDGLTEMILHSNTTTILELETFRNSTNTIKEVNPNETPKVQNTSVNNYYHLLTNDAQDSQEEISKKSALINLTTVKSIMKSSAVISTSLITNSSNLINSISLLNPIDSMKGQYVTANLYRLLTNVTQNSQEENLKEFFPSNLTTENSLRKSSAVKFSSLMANNSNLDNNLPPLFRIRNVVGWNKVVNKFEQWKLNLKNKSREQLSKQTFELPDFYDQVKEVNAQ